MYDDKSQRPFWFPDMRGFLAAAIILMIFVLAVIIFVKPFKFDDTQSQMAAMLLGVLLGCFKDVYGWNFNSNAQSAAKDETIKKLAGAPLDSVTTTTTTTNPEPPHA